MSKLVVAPRSNDVDVVKINNNIVDEYSLRGLSESLKVSAARSKALYYLYETNNSLKEESADLLQQLDEEKNLTRLQTDFVSVVSHEFRNPLSIIKATADVLKRVYKQEENNKAYLRQISKIDKAIIRMNKLIESTLMLSRLDNDKMQFNATSFSLRSLLIEIIDRYTDLADNLTIESRITSSEIMFNGDFDLMDQVFTNLISNAIKYSSGEIKIIIDCSIKQDGIYISVKDNGIGIDEEDIDSLFEKYFRSKNAVNISGTGIGLYLVKHFIELHHGSINVYSKLGEGSEFVVKLPV